MNFINSIGNKAKNTLLQSIASLLEKDPQKNLPKIMKMSKLLASDKSSVDMINSFESSYNNVSDFKSYIDDFLINTDHKILKNFIVNILGNNLNSDEKVSKSISKDLSQPRSLIINAHSNNMDGKALSYNELDKIIIDSRKIGIFTFIISGYESSSFNKLYDIYEKYKDSLFIPVTQQSNLNEISCMRMLKCGNVIPLLQYKNINTDILRKNGIPSFDINYLQCLLKKSKFDTDFSNIKTFSLEFNELSQKKLITYSLRELLETM